MRPLVILLLVLGISIAAVSAFPNEARADEVAPELEGADLRHLAQAELRRLTGAMTPADQRRLVGIYVAFDDNVSDPLAQVACDDDGDYVIVLSDAMLRLLSYVARAASEASEASEASRTRLTEYAAFVAHSQVAGQRLLPPPPGFYVAERSARTYEDRLSDVLSFTVARELSHLRAGDLVCPNPTATRESGDGLWTTDEKRKASEVARTVYPGRQAERDEDATARLLEVGRTEAGAFALLRFFDAFEVASRARRSPFVSSFAAHHPAAAARLAVVEATAASHSARGR